MTKQTLSAPLEFKFLDTGTATDMTFTGYGAVFNNVDYAEDVIAPGAFTKSLADWQAKGQTPAMFFSHAQMSMPIGVWTSLTEDATGLKAVGRFLDTSAGIDAYKTAKAGAITGLSIGYIATQTEMSVVDGKSVRTITEAMLFEISLVTFPCNDLARINQVKTQEIDVNTDEYKAIHAILLEMKADIEALRRKADEVAVETKGDDDDCDCDPETDEDCDCDDDGDEEKAAYAMLSAMLAKMRLTNKAI